MNGTVEKLKKKNEVNDHVNKADALIHFAHTQRVSLTESSNASHNVNQLNTIINKYLF